MKFALTTIVCILFSFSAFGQTYTGTITGVVSDAQGAKVAGAKVTLTNLATKETRALDSNEEGRYTFAQLQPGLYSIQVTMAGFQESVTKSIELSASQTREVNSSLVVGQVSERVEVTAEATTVDTQTANQQASLGGTAVRELPMIARNPLVLFQTQAGVVSPAPGFPAAPPTRIRIATPSTAAVTSRCSCLWMAFR